MYLKCVCGYDGNFINGEWGCFNDSCSSNGPAPGQKDDKSSWLTKQDEK